ncbi:vacuolar protein-sorting-associated protein 25 isoform X1 [Phasianus colchicus]|uniref:vacuolar protein-sorting-associated protein 25 isoform X1 n=1 Tax=Phasianus colchicus TaxID=9054 RepID=UPI00129E1C15|nr:vacuolar protein-sorting-associated protein 25 isoform X1 [Phasianus colchicus]
MGSGRGDEAGRKCARAGRKLAEVVPVSAAMSFAWPWQYSFPPFFTLQPNGETRQKQLAAWCALALAYSRRQRLPAMTLREAQDSPLFANRRLQKSCRPRPSRWCWRSCARTVGGAVLCRGRPGNLEWLDKNKTSFMIMWRRPEEWGKLIYQWVSKNGLTNSVFTLYELISGDDTANEEFHGLDEAMLLRALQALQQEHKAEIITLDDGRGVKFF